MYHRVTRHLTIEVPSTGIAIEFSRAVAMGDDNTIIDEVGLIAKNGDIDKVRALLQGSNDASKWTTIGTLTFGDGTTGSVNAPDHGRFETSDSIPWALVRLKYIVEAAASKRIQLWAGIETFKRG